MENSFSTQQSPCHSRSSWLAFETEGSIPNLKGSAAVHYPETNGSTKQPHSILRSTLISSYMKALTLPSTLFLFAFQIRALCYLSLCPSLDFATEFQYCIPTGLTWRQHASSRMTEAWTGYIFWLQELKASDVLKDLKLHGSIILRYISNNEWQWTSQDRVQNWDPLCGTSTSRPYNVD
jgi:hypothetical protein